MASEKDVIDQEIARVAGDNQEYAATLKNHVANAVGYSNYMKQYKGMPAASSPEYLTKMGKGVEPKFAGTPGGNASSANAGINLVEQERGYIESLARKAKAGSGTAKGKSEQARSEMESLLEQIGNKDTISATLQDMVKNPYNQDGTLMTAEQMKASLVEVYKGEGLEGYEGEEGYVSPEKKANDLIDKYIKDSDAFQARYLLSMGLSEAEAEAAMKANRYSSGGMSDREAEIQSAFDPAFAKSVELFGKGNAKAQQELLKVAAGTADIESYDDFANKYPNLPAEAVKPYFKKSAESDVAEMAESSSLTPITEDTETGEKTAQSFSEFVADERTKDLILTLSEGDYNGILTSAELKGLLFQYYEQKKQEAGISNYVAPSGLGY